MHMQDDFPLLLSTLYDNAVWQYPRQEIVSVEADLSIHRTTYAETDVRIRKLATALSEKLNTARGDAIGTFAWNNHRHHELYWATANTGRICHTLNIRLFADQIVYIVNHAADRVIFVDPDLAPLFAPLIRQFTTVEQIVIMGPTTEGCGIEGAIAYEDLIADVEPLAEWPMLDETSPMMYCYTSGTTGNPRGVAYTQRSTYLHTISNLAANPISAEDNVLPVVPMFHASAWGYPFMAVTNGAKLTYPGPDLSGEGIVRLFVSEHVTFSAGVPTVWLSIQQHLEANPDIDISHIRALFCGGSAVPRSMIDWFEKNARVRVIQGWGMTETNPVAAAATLKPWMEEWPWSDQLDVLATAGRPIPGLQVKIVHEHADVCLVPAEREIVPAERSPCCIDARDESLASGLLISARAVDLSREKEPRDAFGFARCPALVVAAHVVLDRVPVLQARCVFASRLDAADAVAIEL